MFLAFADGVVVVVWFAICVGDDVDESLTIDAEKRRESGKDIGYRQKSGKPKKF